MHAASAEHTCHAWSCQSVSHCLCCMIIDLDQLHWCIVDSLNRLLGCRVRPHLYTDYTHALDRGGLTWPTQMSVDIVRPRSRAAQGSINIVVRIFMVFQRLLCTEYDSRFLALSSNKQVAVGICVDLFKDDHSVEIATHWRSFMECVQQQ